MTTTGEEDDDKDCIVINTPVDKIINIVRDGKTEYIKAIPTSRFDPFEFVDRDCELCIFDNGERHSITRNGKTVFPTRDPEGGCSTVGCWSDQRGHFPAAERDVIYVLADQEPSPMTGELDIYHAPIGTVVDINIHVAESEWGCAVEQLRQPARVRLVEYDSSGSGESRCDDCAFNVPQRDRSLDRMEITSQGMVIVTRNYHQTTGRPACVANSYKNVALGEDGDSDPPCMVSNRSDKKTIKFIRVGE